MYEMKKILIMDDKNRLVQNLKKSIQKYEVVSCERINEAVNILCNEDISIFVVDLNLGYSEDDGDIAYDKLFDTGKSIPAIILTGQELPEDEKNRLLDKGFSKIISKYERGSISKSLTSAIDEIVGNCIELMKHPRSRMRMLGAENHNLMYNGNTKTIDEWINSIINWDFEEEDASKLKNLIIKLLIAYGIRKDDYGFKTMN